jgi:hypothetical protein
MSRNVPGNVGVLDEVVRIALIALILVGLAFALTRLDADWIPMLVLPAGLAIDYLVLTSVAHADFFYELVGRDTRHRAGKR